MRCIGNFSFPQPRTPLPGVQSHSLQNAIVLLPMQSKQLLCQITIYKNRIGDYSIVDAWVWNAEGRPGLCTTAFLGHENKMPQEWTARFFQDKAPEVRRIHPTFVGPWANTVPLTTCRTDLVPTFVNRRSPHSGKSLPRHARHWCARLKPDATCGMHDHRPPV